VNVTGPEKPLTGTKVKYPFAKFVIVNVPTPATVIGVPVVVTVVPPNVTEFKPNGRPPWSFARSELDAALTVRVEF
jgi:hypothetical protein